MTLHFYDVMRKAAAVNDAISAAYDAAHIGTVAATDAITDINTRDITAIATDRGNAPLGNMARDAIDDALLSDIFP